MASNTIDDLRNHLFETLKALRAEGNQMDLARARTVAEVAKVVIESAKVEVDFLRVTGGTKSTDFLPDGDASTVPGQRRLTPVDSARKTG